MDQRKGMEKRSSERGIAQLSLQLTFPGMDEETAVQGVGGRRCLSPSPAGGGGYQKNREIFEIRPGVKKSADPRLDELAVMGLADYWLQVAEYLGVDAFLGMWRILDSNQNGIPRASDANSLAPRLRTYSNYLRFQKNRFVENLAAQGISPREIQARVRSQLCETISIRHITRLAKAAKLKR